MSVSGVVPADVTLRADTRARALRAGKLAAVVAVVALIAWRIDWSRSFGELTSSSIAPIAAALVAFTLAAALKAPIWAALLRGLGRGEGVRARDLVSPVFIGLLGNWVAPARLGEAARVVLAEGRVRRRGTDLGFAAVAGGAAAELLVSTAAWAVLALVAALLLPVPGYVAGVAAGGGLLVTALIVVAVRSRAVAPPRTRPTSRLRRLLRAVRTTLRSASEGLRALRAPRRLALVAGAGVAAMVLQWFGTFMVLRALGLDLGLAAAAAVLVTTTVAQTVPILPGGVGSFQAAVGLPLIASYGVAGAEALAAGLLLQATQALTGIGPGLLFLAREDLDLRTLRRMDRPAASAVGASPGGTPSAGRA
ncbi:MAG: lysylphosphatidylglycerol synthase domain-containing protein [Miltoncostaeaceae bacterium]